MYIIVSYDVQIKRCSKVMKIFRKYLYHVHNSVFEGELTEKEYKLMVSEINKIINKEKDSVIYYKLVSSKVITKETINVKTIDKIIL